MKTLIVNLYGAPGAGKSVTAAEVFAELKKKGVTTELVREHVKEFVWAGGNPGVFDELAFFGEQVRRESLLYGKVRVLVTDKPLLMHPFYCFVNGYNELARGLILCCNAHRNSLADQGHDLLHVFCELPKDESKFEQAGRLQNYKEARYLDEKLFRFLLECRATPHVSVDGHAATSTKQIVDQILEHLSQ